MRSENHRVTRAAGLISGAALLSRFSGFARDMAIAGLLGTGFRADVFFAGFGISNLVRKLFSEGLISLAFIPVFTQLLEKFGKKEAVQFSVSCFKILAVTLFIITAVGILLCPGIISIIVPGFIKTPEKLVLTVKLARIMFPYIFFIGLSALSVGILNSLGSFAGPAFTPLILNITMIGSLLVVYHLKWNPEIILAFGVILGGIFQFGFQIPFLLKKGITVHVSKKQKTCVLKKRRVFHPAVKKTGKASIAAIFGSGVYHINMLVAVIVASFLSEGSVSCLYYADRLIQIPMGLFAISAAAAVLPSFSRQASKKNLEELNQTLAYTIRLTLFITIPAVTGIIILREPIIELLFQRGAFDFDSVRSTGVAVIYLGIGIIAFSVARIISTAFFATGNIRTPALSGLASILFNLPAGILLTNIMGFRGVPLSVSLASVLNLAMLALSSKFKPCFLRDPAVLHTLLKTLACSIIMGYTALKVSNYFIQIIGPLGVLTGIGVGIIIFSGLSYFFMKKEVSVFLGRAG